MRDQLKALFLHLMKYAGIFWLSRRLTRRELRILCYHNFSLRDEHRFRSRLYMRPETFKQRLDFLLRRQIPVLSLGDALAQVEAGTLPDNAVVITIDDGWYGTFANGIPALHERKMPATLYVTTWYQHKQVPVFDVALGYLFWASHANSVNLEAIDPSLTGVYDLIDPAEEEVALEQLREFAAKLEAPAQLDLLYRIGQVIDVDFEPLHQQRLFSLMTDDELREVAESGVELQLHTHRHRVYANDASAMQTEIEDNRAVLSPLASGELVHFCYPSGVYDTAMWPALRDSGVVSATTTEVGFCTSETPMLAIPRIVDGEEISMIEFEAELSGFLELVRRARGRSNPPVSVAQSKA
ncbi:MAG: polysaccharide deacetylase family protein [Gammaproteobacteria bacterium]|nr:polysaccharide deacetylase family protein [Gammaproteobacteria bacterium]